MVYSQLCITYGNCAITLLIISTVQVDNFAPFILTDDTRRTISKGTSMSDEEPEVGLVVDSV